MARVYVSSTYLDLSNHRQVVYRALRLMGHDAVAMEDYVASDSRPLARCLEDVSHADIYIGLIAWRLGYIPSEDNPKRRSITQLEYDKASQLQVPRLLFLLSPAAPWPREFHDTEPLSDSENSVQAFRDQVSNAHIVSFFETPEDLQFLISIAVRKWEIDSGYRPRVPALTDQIFPPEFAKNVISYIPNTQLKVRYQVPIVNTAFRVVFMAFWFGLPLTVLYVELADAFAAGRMPRDIVTIVALPLFLLLGAWGALRKPTITFDFKERRIDIQGLGGFSKGSAVVDALRLIHDQSPSGWRCRLLYGHYELARTARFSAQQKARERLINFATALNHQLGMHTLREADRE